MANKFWVGGTGTWDTSTQGHWATVSNGSPTGVAPPTSADAVIFDGNSGGGTVTVNLGGSGTFLSITAGAFTGTLDFSVNNNSVTCTSTGGFNFSGSGVRTIKLGSGTFTTAYAWTLGTVTSLTWDAGTSTIVMAPPGTTIAPFFTGGGLTYNNVQFTPTTRSVPPITINSANTFANLQINGNTTFPGATQTITSSFSINGASGSPVIASATGTQVTIALGTSTCTVTWAALAGLNFTSTGSPSASNSFDCGGNTNITITQPSGGGGGLITNIGMNGGLI